MIKLVAAVALLAAAPALAQTASTTEHSKTTTTTSKPTLGPSTHTVNKQTNTTVASNDDKGHMAVHTTKTGKKITYDCSKAGNKTKAACKKGA